MTMTMIMLVKTRVECIVHICYSSKVRSVVYSRECPIMCMSHCVHVSLCECLIECMSHSVHVSLCACLIVCMSLSVHVL